MVVYTLMVVLGKVTFNQMMEIGNTNLTGGTTGFGGEVITLTSIISITVNDATYHKETTTQEEGGMNRFQ